MPTYPYHLVEVFASTPLKGNLLAVIHDADDIPTETMQLLARRFNISETSFIQTAPETHQTYRHRIFTPASELPFAGHPSLGSAAVWTKRQGATSAEIVQLTISGSQKLRVAFTERVASVDLWQNPATFGGFGSFDYALAALALPNEAAHPTLVPQAVSTGVPFLIIPLADWNALGAISVDWSRIDQAFAVDGPLEPHGAYVVAEVEPGAWRARMFSRSMPGGEDPATGGAAGPFGAYLKHYTGETSIVIDQGVEMGSPSRILVRIDDGIVVSGEVQFLAEGTISLES